MKDYKQLAQEIDLALDDGTSADDVCDVLRMANCRPTDIFNDMIHTWRIFSPDFRLACSQENRKFIYGLSRKLPDVMKKNYHHQVAGLRRVEANQRPRAMYGRVNIFTGPSFPSGTRQEIHDAFSFNEEASDYAHALSQLSDLGERDIADSIWAGRIYQADFFDAASPRLKFAMLRYLHKVDPVIAQPFVAQILRDDRIPLHFRVLVWGEGVVRPHQGVSSPNGAISRVYGASAEERSKRLEAAHQGEDEAVAWFKRYSDGDKVSSFAIQRLLCDFRLCRSMIEKMVERSYFNILSHCLREHGREFEEAYPLGEFAGLVCSDGKCTCAISLLKIVGELNPAAISGYRDVNGATLLEHVLYRCTGDCFPHESWIRKCIKDAECAEIIRFLIEAGCDITQANNVGIAWTDIVDVANRVW